LINPASLHCRWSEAGQEESLFGPGLKNERTIRHASHANDKGDPITLAQRTLVTGRPSDRLTLTARAYIGAVCTAGFLLLLIPPAFPIRDTLGFATFLVLGALAQLLPIHFHKNTSVSMSMAVALAAILVFGPTYASWVNLASGVVHYCAQVRPKGRPFYRSALTTSTLVIAAWVSGQIYVALGGQVGVQSDYLRALALLVVVGTIYYLINTVMITAAISLEQAHPFWELLKTNYLWLTFNIASLTPLGFGIALIYQHIGLPGLVLFLLPMAMAWYSFHLYSNSIEDVRKANEELKIANDQVTKANQDLKDANERVRESNGELTEANGRLNIMYEVSRSFAGSLHLESTLDRIVEATKLMGLPAAFVAGPLSEKGKRVPNWRTSCPAFAQWTLMEPDKLAQTSLGKVVADLYHETWFCTGEPQVASAGELCLQIANYVSAAEQDQLSSLVLVPLLVRGDSWWVVGIGSKRPPTPLGMKELLIFRSMAESALEMALAHEQAKRDATIDTRTGLYNHRFFQEAIQRELAEAAKRNGILGFLMLDVDNFKEFNDVYGHLIGDQVLEVIARIIRECVRETDTVCRYGGDEMCVLLPNTDRARGIEIATRIDRAIRAYTFHARRESGARQGEIEQLGLRVSIGLATFPESAQTRAGLVEQADRACYRAKAVGGGVAVEPQIVEAEEHVVQQQFATT
jgi:diguanylate cyclase (GGDEF)-like protein